MSDVRLYADRVKETTTTTGTGNATLAGAVDASYQTFNTAFGVGPSFYYEIAHQSAAEAETGIGHLSGSTTLVRDSVLTSSNGGALVNFSAGTKDVFNTMPAYDAQRDEVKGRATAKALGYTMS